MMERISRLAACLATILGVLLGTGHLSPADCNQNGIDDDTDIMPGDLRFLDALYHGPDFPEWSWDLQVVAADFNGDGALDLAKAYLDPASLTVLLNQGDGAFRSNEYPLEAEVLSLIWTAADINADRKPDLVAAQWIRSDSSTIVAILLNNGDRTFQAPVNHRLDGYVTSLLAADLNGDQASDLVATHWHRSDLTDVWEVSLLMNFGDGTFQAAVEYPVEEASFALAADFNGD